MIVRAAVILGAGAVLLTACSGSGNGTPSRMPSSTRAASTAPSTPVSSASTVSLPSLPSGAIALPSLPSSFGTANPCASASTPFTAASAYLGVAQLGRTDLAQRCVRGSTVPRATTASLTAGSVTDYFVPTGTPGGTTIAFHRIDGSTSVEVTVARSGTGYAVTRVTTG